MTIYDADGNELEDTDIVPDGGVVKVRCQFMDSRMPWPYAARAYGRGSTADELEQAARDEYAARSQRMSNAWRNPPPWQRTAKGSKRVVPRGSPIPWGGAPDSNPADQKPPDKPPDGK